MPEVVAIKRLSKLVRKGCREVPKKGPESRMNKNETVELG
jgi:hypothetical protein